MVSDDFYDMRAEGSCVPPPAEGGLGIADLQDIIKIELDPVDFCCVDYLHLNVYQTENKGNTEIQDSSISPVDSIPWSSDVYFKQLIMCDKKSKCLSTLE